MKELAEISQELPSNIDLEKVVTAEDFYFFTDEFCEADLEN